jgi:hypothetical protein
MKSEALTCYMCDAQSVGKEHVPPKCLFPNEPRYRTSLVKVPSCDEHNSGKSTDDQLLRWVLAVVNAHSELARKILDEGALRLLEEKPHLQETFLPNLRSQVSSGGMPKSVFGIDPARFHSSITSIARGLYYHHTWHTHKALGPMEIQWRALRSLPVALEALDLSDDAYFAFTSPAPNQPEYTLGGNPEVFRYGFDLNSDSEHAFCILRFYEGEAIYVRWKKEKREYSTSLRSLIEFLRDHDEFVRSTSKDPLENSRSGIGHQLASREMQLAAISKEAKRKRDFGAFKLVKMLREEYEAIRARCSGDRSNRRPRAD